MNNIFKPMILTPIEMFNSRRNLEPIIDSLATTKIIVEFLDGKIGIKARGGQRPTLAIASNELPQEFENSNTTIKINKKVETLLKEDLTLDDLEVEDLSSKKVLTNNLLNGLDMVFLTLRQDSRRQLESLL